MKELFIGDELYHAGFWVESGIDGPALTNHFVALLRKGEFEKAASQVRLLQDNNVVKGFDIRLRNVENLMRDFIFNIEQVTKSDSSLKLEKLVSYDDIPIVLNSDDAIDCSRLGRFCRLVSAEKFSSFDADFSCLDDEVVDKLRFYNFDEKIKKHSALEYRVMENVYIHGANKHFYSFVENKTYFDPQNSARLAKSTNTSFFKERVIKSIDFAILLPIPHASSNYYHSISEMVYALSSIDEFNKNAPIIYSEDKFGVLRFISDNLGFDWSRFHSIRDVSDSVIAKAISIFPTNFYWSSSLFSFFNKFGSNVLPFRKIYISRRQSSRALNNEVDVEAFLSENGFDIIFAEELSVNEQIKVFSETKVLVASHGAGLTNIAFMKKNTTLIEVFNDTSIVNHFYLRSRHNEMKYIPLFAMDNEIDIPLLNCAIS
ncbi:glycosyltransferase family 61 protein [Aeromonas veronii]|uniref:glycosyltransferase family 61 protein n=1 Tax=Aeromonas veronii TaxID=654 RepID=UPI003D1FB9E7